MILLVNRAVIKTDLLDEALAVARTMQEATRQEAGCVRYQVFEVHRDEPEIYIHEEWESQAALDDHFAMPHCQQFNQQWFRFLDGEMKIHRYEVSAL